MKDGIRMEAISIKIQNCKVIKDLTSLFSEDNQYRDFTPLEKACIVYQCQDAAMEERHTAWHWIIDNEKDCSFETELLDGIHHYESLKKFLLNHMETENELVKHFININNEHKCIYEFEICDKSGRLTFPFVFSDFRNGLDFISKHLNEDVLLINCETKDINPNPRHIESDKGFVTSYSDNNYRAIIGPDLKFRRIYSMINTKKWNLGDAVFEGLM